MIDGLFFGALKSTFAILEALAEYIFLIHVLEQ